MDQSKITSWDSATFMLLQTIRGQQFFLTLPKVFDLLCSDVHVAVNCWDCVIVLCTACVLGPRCCMNFQRAFFSTLHDVLAGKKDQRCLFPALIFFYKPPWNLWFIISVVRGVLRGLGNNQLWIFHAKGNKYKVGMQKIMLRYVKAKYFPNVNLVKYLTVTICTGMSQTGGQGGGFILLCRVLKVS